MDLDSRLQRIHDGCFRLCHEALGKYLLVAGNIGIFCQSEEEYENFSKLKEDLTYPSDNPNQKYFKLKNPIRIGNPVEKISATYTHLYIRKPNPNSPEAGDVDFVLTNEEYAELNKRVRNGQIPAASIYDRPGWDTIELRNPEIDALAYVSTKEMAEKVRVRFD